MGGTAQNRTSPERRGAARPAVLYLVPAAATAAAILAWELGWFPFPEHPFISVLGLALTAIAGAAVAIAWKRETSSRNEERHSLEVERAFHLQALAQLHEAVVGVGPDFVIRAWNQAAERVYGYTAAEAVGRHVREIMVTEKPDGGTIDDLVEQLRREMRVTTVARRRRKDGTWFDAELSISAILDESGRVLGYAGVHRDATEVRRDEAAMRAAKAEVELFMSRAPAGLFRLDAQGKLVFLNEMLCVMTGLPPERIAAGGPGWMDAVHPEDRARVSAAWDEAWRHGRTFRTEFRFGTEDEVTWVLATAMALLDAEGGHAGVVGVVTDVTGARRMQERLSQAERLASIGTLASGMAHEINNPLACVLSSLAFASEQTAARPDLREVGDALAEAREAAERVARIVRELQAFSGARGERERLDLRGAVKEALALVPEAMRRRARVALDLDPVPVVEACPQAVPRVLYHLLANAFQAVPEERAGQGEVRAATSTAADGSAVVEIRDDGRGIPAEHLRHVFDPFFTTSESGKGAGLGLAVCYGLVSAMAGELEVESAGGKGTVFRLRLPPAGTSAALSP